ncbi:recombinase family protein [Skermanella aerolata]|uniref:recombinase family protein n=1 Tax=Skermanella aerolata TaxID=393310 RepID=UPI003D22684C
MTRRLPQPYDLRRISNDPGDQLLLQIQGAVAEYERALLAERFHRGKLQKARRSIPRRAPAVGLPLSATSRRRRRAFCRR